MDPRGTEPASLLGILVGFLLSDGLARERIKDHGLQSHKTP